MMMQNHLETFESDRHWPSHWRAWACGIVISSVALAGCQRPEPPPDVRTMLQSSDGTGTISCPVRGGFTPDSGYYSQFYEDYVLGYVFKDVAQGTYVDVGANDPTVNSVTRHFYDRGWRGINIEPIPALAEQLRRLRPNDVNLAIGISDSVGELTFYQSERLVISTFDAEVMQRHKAKGIKFEEIRIPVSTLDAVFEQQQPLVGAGITFLNADVEGYEKQVFSGIDFKRYQPQVVMAESTAPNTEIPTHQAWESLLTSAGYVFAMDDGLNRYYVHASRRNLLPRFLEINYCVGLDKLAKRLKLDGFLPVKS